MTLDPQVAQLLSAMAQADLPLLETLSPDQARAQYEQGVQMAAGPPPALFDVRDEQAQGPLGQIPLRIYTPRDPAGEAMPTLIYIHGGGYVIGSLDSHDVPCRYLARAADCIVVSVDYRMAPEHPFPEPVDDCWAAVNWIVDHIEELGGRSDRVAIGGDSAGGNLATVMCLLARDRGGPRLVHQMLIYPGTDMDGAFASYDRFGQDFQLTVSLIGWFVNHYFSGDNQDRQDPRCSPLRADLAGLPPALVVSAGYDPLQDEDLAYHEKLLQAGVPSRHSHYPGMIHGFINMTGVLDTARECLNECGSELREAFAAAGR